MLLFSYLTILRLTFFTKIVKSSMNLGSFLRSNKIVTWSAIFVSLYVHLSSPEPFYSSILIFSTEVKIGRTKKGISSYRRHLCFQSLFFSFFGPVVFPLWCASRSRLYLYRALCCVPHSYSPRAHFTVPLILCGRVRRSGLISIKWPLCLDIILEQSDEQMYFSLSYRIVSPVVCVFYAMLSSIPACMKWNFLWS